MALTTFTTYQETQKAGFCDICLEHITNLYYGNITFKFTEEKSVKGRLSRFNVKENVNSSMNFTIIMNIILFNLCQQKYAVCSLGFFITHTWTGNTTCKVSVF